MQTKAIKACPKCGSDVGIAEIYSGFNPSDPAAMTSVQMFFCKNGNCSCNQVPGEIYDIIEQEKADLMM